MLSLLLVSSSSLFAQMDPALVEGVERALGLEEFRQALESHPTAERSVIHREGDVVAIQPQEAVLNTTRAIEYSKNQAIELYCTQWLANFGAPEGQPTYADRALKCGVNSRLIESFNECCQEAKNSVDSGGFLALSWIQVAEDLQMAIEDEIFHIAKGGSPLEIVSRPPTRTTPATLQLANYKVELIESLLRHQPPKIVNAWEKIVNQSQRLVAKYRRAEILDSNKSGLCFNRDHCKECEELLYETTCSLKKAIIADQEGKHSLASLWFNLTHGNQNFLEYYQNRDHGENLTFIKEEARDLDTGNRKYLESIKSMQSMIEKVMEADEKGCQEEVVLYEKAASQCQRAMESYQEKVLLWRKAAEQYQVAAECEKQAAEAYAQGNIVDGDCFHEEAIQTSKIAKKAKQVDKIDLKRNDF